MPETAAVSLLASLGCSELTGLVPGGIIVPFYFALYADDLMRVAATVATALPGPDAKSADASHFSVKSVDKWNNEGK